MVFLFASCLQMASASVIQPGMMDDFEDGTTASWIKGIELTKAKILPPRNVANADESNRFLEVKSTGSSTNDNVARDPHSRMVFFNESQWTGDYSGITSITAMMKATSSTEDNLFMRLALYDEKITGESQSRYVSAAPEILKTDGEWHSMFFSLNPSDLVRFRGEKTAEQVLSNVGHLRFLSSKDNAAAWQVDKIEATLGIDNITAVSALTAVPLPGAVWFMISAMTGLMGIKVRQKFCNNKTQ